MSNRYDKNTERLRKVELALYQLRYYLTHRGKRIQSYGNQAKGILRKMEALQARLRPLARCQLNRMGPRRLHIPWFTQNQLNKLRALCAIDMRRFPTGRSK